MVQQLIAPDQLPAWVPGRLTVHNPDAGWDGVSVRGYRYGPSDVVVPPLRDYTVVAYRRGVTPMRRRVDTTWTAEELGPGDVSLLTRAVGSHWVWPRDIEVVHVYLTHDELTATCRQMYERDVADVELHDTVKAEDPAIYRTILQIAHEAAQGAAGSRLMVDSLSCQLAVQILRRHAHVLFRECGGSDGLTFEQDRAVRDYVHDHLAETVSLDDLAAVARLSRFHFARKFRATIGTTPHAFVLQQRVERARTLLERTGTPIPDIAASCGFADQPHLTREFKKRVGVTPGRYRSRQH
ncbi:MULTISPECIES: helix-turn-helix domain-containing protein [unclassified Geodermatophilus]|uniref:helix-turn-helix domain-containing protein n=1 Tax=unclassified Geodermatophilus TaxID=2637632 RepID=UPI003EEDE340